ncbi:hypothetical protein [Arcanobacterium hippocoleae]|uniref:hypothetical protein n=1 Tax=Arcanobacterium hippocoleae TaxID=149017 RepID=UPI00286C46EF|nr:hypothetical protein [Arcanobacterium hippocoleae]
MISRKKWLLLGVSTVAIASIACGVWFFIITNMADDFQERNAEKEWIYQDINNGDELSADYLSKDTLYLFSTNDAIRSSYDFEQCRVGSTILSKIDTHFNLPSKNGQALFLVGQFKQFVDVREDSPRRLSLTCNNYPKGNQLGLGYMKEDR